MSEKIKKIIAIALILGIQAAGLSVVYAEESEEEKQKVPVRQEQDLKNEKFLLQLKNQLQNARNEYFQVSKSIDEAKERLITSRDVISSLNAQIENLDYLISNTQAKIRNVEKQISEKQNLIELYRDEIKIKQIELENQKLVLRDYLRALYLQENTFLSKKGDPDISASKLLLGDASIGDTFKEIEYYAILKQTGQNIFGKLETVQNEYKTARLQLQQTRQKLKKLDRELEDEKKNLKLQKHAKNGLLTQTKGEEKIYRELIAQSKREQLAIVEEVNKLKENLTFIETKINEDGENFDPDNYKDLINPNVRAVYDFEMLGEFATGEKLNWPVEPSRGISAYFQDSSYLKAFGIPHRAIDLPVPQGSAVRAPASGVVYKVKDNGDSSYSYIILAHKGGLLTVYGHMYQVMVDERDVVLPGEVIGLSGGIPGTKGAGYLTTGAHLHFETVKNGKHVDPLYLMDLDKIDEEYIPEHFKDLDLLDLEDNEE